MACRLSGDISCPQELRGFLIVKKLSTTNVDYDYFVDDSVDLAALGTSFFSIGRSEVELLSPQQRLLLEVSRESLEDAGEVGYAGKIIGVSVGSLGSDWSDICSRDALRAGPYTFTCSHDFIISERVSHEIDLRRPR
jgi:acyl transferase domain-containing protein